MTLDDILDKDPFSLPNSSKEAILLPIVREATVWHFKHSKEFKNICAMHNFDPFASFSISDLPFLPVSLFKKFELLSVPKNEIVKTLYSSSTSGHPSKIFLDKTTANSQIKALSKILTDYFGKDRRYFIVFDNEDTLKSTDGSLSSRNTAIRGILGLAKKVDFILDKNLRIDLKKLKRVANNLSQGDRICFFGFTWLVHNVCNDPLKDFQIKKIFKDIKSTNKLFLHIGGWKKLQDLNVSKSGFNKLVGDFTNVKVKKIVDFYGMTEQLGTVYPDCSEGFKHVPLYSDIIIRDITTTESLAKGKAGLVQFVSPIAHSYPGISILSDDIGRIVGVDDCECGRMGKYFVFEKRAEFAELRGCGDTLDIKNES